MAVLVVVAIVLMISELGTSQLNNNSTNINTPIRLSCGSNPAMSSSSFISNLNSTIAQLRSHLSNNGVYFARAQNLRNGDSVYGLAQCRNYLSTVQCLACYDAAVSAVETCSSVNGAHVFLDNCFLRYENFDEYYDNPQTTMDVGTAPAPICGSHSSSQPTNFNQTLEELLSGIQDATPRTSNFYVASTRQVSNENATIYAIAQCVENTSQAICQNCMNTANNILYSCLPMTEGRTIDLGCFMRYSETPFFQDNQTTSIVPYSTKGGSRRLGMIIGASIGVAIVLFILALSLWYKSRKRPKADEENSQFHGVKNYRYSDLQSATHDFSEEYRIGKGGYGEVFKAIVDNENVVAVKKLHVLHGWSTNGSELLLVLEYMPQGSLDKFLWGEKRGTLNWKQRFDIIFGIARDFGLARFQPEDKSHVSTRFAGTLGYTAPEYATYGHLSEKVDTYSFGIVALEIISGRRCTDVSFDGYSNHYLLQQAWEMYEKEIHIQLIDESLDPMESEKEQVMKITEIALMCTQSPVNIRPAMSEVLIMLSSGPSLKREQITRPTFIDPDKRFRLEIK
uniref:Cysteine-rich receptor-like protein kinase 2 n=1 Tax=Tanacetum cinerariifolium TaxID=118510 RepID=A0A6L2MWD8_TANCI|nr:cysteine-rich receptor-like protein kinase 2 [Tanacetum cinerariifolium]